MALNMLNLPAYNVGTGADFSGLNSGLDSIRQDKQQQVQNHLAQSQLGMQKERLGMERESHQANQHQIIAQRVGGMAQMGLAEKDPARRQAILDRALSMHPDKTKLGPEYLSPDTAFPLLVQEAQGFLGQKDKADIEYKQAQAQKALREAANGGETPANIREWQAFQRMSEQQRQEYLTMKRAQPWLNQGTQFTQPNPVAPGGPPVASLPIDNAGKAAQKTVGTGQGQAIVDLPKVQQSAAATLRYVDEVLKDSNLGNVTGWQARVPTLRPASVDTEERIAQLGGRAFLSAFESLKGGGQITEIEGQKATSALGRLTNLKQSDKGFRTALQDFRNEVMDLVRLAERKARGAGPYAPPPGVPTDGVPRENTDRLPPSPPGWSIKRID